MKLLIGENIKRLRAQKGVTQEALAEYMHVSTAAVSKWERNESMPDITMVIPLASYFGVSSDFLLGIEIDRREEEVGAILEEYKKLSASGEKSKRYNLVKDSVIKYPGEFRILILYAEELLASPYNGTCGHTDMTQDKIHEINSNVIEICDRILRECAIDDVRFRALNLTSQAYMEENDLTNSEKYARMLPDWWDSSNMTLYRIMDTDSTEHTKFRQENIADLANLLWLWIRSEVWVMKTPDEKIILCNKALSIYQTLYENSDYGYANELVGQIWPHLGDAYLEKGDKDAAMDAIERMVEHKVIMDRIDGTAHTSMLFDKLVYRQDDLTRSFTCTNREIALSWLKENKYDNIRNDKKFQHLLKKLEA